MHRALWILEQHRIFWKCLSSVNTNIEYQDFCTSSLQMTGGEGEGRIKGQDLVTGYSPVPPRRPNINSFVSSWWKPPLRQHFWPSEQLVNNESSSYYWAIIKIFSSNEESYRRQDDLIIKWSASVSRPILVGNSNIYSLISKEMVSLFLARLNKQSITLFLFL